MDPQFKIVGHRGAPAYAPENTLKSFRKAYECGATAIEFDVRLTADQVPVIIHDETTERVAGAGGPVAEMKFEDLRKISVGGEKIPTLEEVLTFAKDRLAVDVEIKVIGVEKRVVRLIHDFGLTDKALITSFIPPILSQVKRLDPRIRVGVLCSEWDDEYLDIAAKLDAYALLPNYKSVNEDLVRKVRKDGFKLIVWTVNNLEDIEKMISLGVDGIITDDPCKARKIITV